MSIRGEDSSGAMRPMRFEIVAEFDEAPSN